MKKTTRGKSHNENWYGLKIITKIPLSWKSTIETLCWEVWKLTVTTPNGVTNSVVLKKAGDNPSVCLKKNLFHRNYWYIITGDLLVEDCDEDK